MKSRVTQKPCYTGRHMANLTITIDDALLRRARMRALEQGTSVNALLREYLVAYAGSAQLQERALADLLELSTTATSRSWSSSRVQVAAPRREVAVVESSR